MAWWPFGKSRKRVFVLGLDGAPCSGIEHFLAEGLMPNLAALVGGSRLTRMHSCYPTVSSVAWSCFQTGLSPGGFGIYGFAELTPGMELRIPDSKDLKAKTIWEILSENDRRVIGIGVPQTFPAREVNGILVGDFLAPSVDKAVYPAAMLPRFKEWGYRLDVDANKARESLDFLRPDLLRCLAGRRNAIEGLWDSEKWDLFVAHVMETDRLGHFMWRFLAEPESQNGKFVREFFRHVDELIGSIAKRLDEQTDFILMSDHGFCEVKREAQLNRWLEAQGYLSYDGQPTGFESLSAQSRALALVPGRIHILSEGKWRKGCIKPAEYEPLRQEIMAKLREFATPEGDPVCRDILTREKAFTGPYADQAPDIIVHPHDGYDLKAALGPGAIFTTSPICGMHTREDATLFIRGATLPDKSPMLWDIAPTILHLLDIPCPQMDGKSLLQ